MSVVALALVALIVWVPIPMGNRPAVATHKNNLFALIVTCALITWAISALIQRKLGDWIGINGIYVQGFLSLIPLSFFLVVSATIAYTIARLGYLPKPGVPDPKTIGLSFGVFGLAWLFALLLFTIIYARMWSSSNEVGMQKMKGRLFMIVFIVTWTSFVTFVRVDPWNLLKWLFD